MTNSILQDYIERIKDLQDNRCTPHKPFLLLIIIEMIESGELYENYIPYKVIKENKIHFFQDLIEAFNESNESKNWQPNINTPFFHLKTNGFWHLDPPKLQAKSPATTPTDRQLCNDNATAKLDESFFILLTEPEHREIIRQTIINRYFQKSREAIENLIEEQRLIWKQQIEKEAEEYSESLLKGAEHPFSPYKKVESIKKETPVRSAGFRKAIMKIYKHACAVCELNTRAANGESITDAAHIIPFHVSYNDNVQNGISLCKSHHWAFDAKLFSLSKTYQVIVAPFALKHESTRWIQELRDKSIWLPKETKYRPAQYALTWHRERVTNQ